MQYDDEKLKKAQEEAKVEWSKWLAEQDSEEPASYTFTIKSFSSKKDWATDFTNHPHGGRKATDDEVAKYLYAYQTQLMEWGLTPLHCRNLLVTYADWGAPDFDDN